MSVRWQHCLDHADNIQKPAESPDCLLGVVIKSSISSETTKHFRYKCHELFVKSPVMITVKSFVNCRSMEKILRFVYKSL